MRTFILLGALLGAGSAGAAGADNITDCSPANCGGFAQNKATLHTWSSYVYASWNPGQVNVHFGALTDLNRNPVPIKTFKVYYGVLINKVAAVTYLGEITVANGYYDGPIWNGNAPYLFPSGTFLTGHFYFNDMSVPNTQFVSAMGL